MAKSTDLPHDTVVRYWGAEQENDGSFDPNAIWGMTIPPLAVGEMTTFCPDVLV